MADKVNYTVLQPFRLGRTDVPVAHTVAVTNPGKPGKVNVEYGFSVTPVAPSEWQQLLQDGKVRRQQ